MYFSFRTYPPAGRKRPATVRPPLQYFLYPPLTMVSKDRDRDKWCTLLPGLHKKIKLITKPVKMKKCQTNSVQSITEYQTTKLETCEEVLAIKSLPLPPTPTSPHIYHYRKYHQCVIAKLAAWVRKKILIKRK